MLILIEGRVQVKVVLTSYIDSDFVHRYSVGSFSAD